jgi:hypothetical protein
MVKLNSILALEHCAIGFTVVVISLITQSNKCHHQGYNKEYYPLLTRSSLNLY